MMCMRARPSWSDMMAMDFAEWTGVIERLPADDGAMAILRMLGR